jgi:hypothetical protein
MRRTALIVPMLLGMSAGCGDGGGTGFYAGGAIQMTITDPNSTMPGQAGFTIPTGTRIDATLPPDASVGFTGTCAVGPHGRTVTINGVGQDSPATVSITMPDWSQDNCTSCTHGTITFDLQHATFTGQENRGTGTTPACTFSASRNGNDGMSLTGSCPALTSPADPRTVAVNVNLMLSHCATQ